MLLAAAAAALALAGFGRGSASAEQTPRAAAPPPRPAGVAPPAGPGVTDVFVKIPRGSTATVATLPGLRIVAGCDRGGFERFEIEPSAGNVGLRVTGKGDDGPIAAGGRGRGVSLNEAAPVRNRHGISTFSATRPGEPAVVGTLGYEAGVSIDGETVCAVYGKVVA